MESLKNMHQQILHNVEMVQDRSSKILQEQEKDLLRAFRARLFDVQVWRRFPLASVCTPYTRNNLFTSDRERATMKDAAG